MRGPRGGMIMVTQKGLDKDPDLAKKIDKSVFPGLQGGPHDHTTAGIATALKEAMHPSFKEYSEQIVRNSRALAKSLMENDLKVVTGGSDNHMLLVEVGKGKGFFAQHALDLANITLNKNTVPADPSSPFYPSGIRMGTPSLTTRGIKEKEMKLIGQWIAKVISEIENFDMPEDKEKRKKAINEFKEEISKNQEIKKIQKEVIELAKKFPLYPDFDILK
tara:strand:- start:16 stop:672 length:657 start_codon:yes stop_codon:yes gene_type:complete